MSMMFKKKYYSNELDEKEYENSTNIVETKFTFVNYKRGKEDNNIQLLTTAIQNRKLSELRQLLNAIPFYAQNNVINQCNSENGLPFLHLACRSNFSQSIELLLENGADISSFDEEGRQAIHIAARFYRFPRNKAKIKDKSKNDWASKESCLQTLIKRGASVNARDRYQATPLHYACAKGHLTAVETILQSKDVMVEALDNHQSSPLHEATKGGHFEVVQKLLEYCTQKNVDILHLKDKTGSTPLIFASRNGYTKIVDALLKASNQSSPGGSLLRMMDRDWHGNSALHVAVEGGYVETAKLLLDAWKKQSTIFQGTYDYFISEKPYVDLERSDGATAMHLAANQGAADILQVLIDENAIVNCVDENNETPLYLAAEKRHVRSVEILLHNKCNMETSNYLQMTPFLIACKNNHHVIARVLIRAGADVTAVDDQSRNCFILTSASGNDDTLQVLLELPEHKDLMNDCDIIGNTAIHEAARYGHLSILQSLVSEDMPLNIYNDCDETALHFAVVNNHIDVVTFIVSKERARLDDVDEYSRTPLFLAASHGHHLILEKLIEFDAETDVGDVNSWTALHVCSWKGLVECAKKVLEADPSLIEKTTQQKETALHLACHFGYSEIVKLLLEWKSDVTSRQMDGKNPLDIAIDENHETCVRILLEDKRWKQSLQNVTYASESSFVSTPLRKMIKTMPDVVELVLTKCISKNGKEMKHKDFEVTINYDLIEDMYEMLIWKGGEMCDGYQGENEEFYESLLKQKSNSLHWTLSPLQPTVQADESTKLYDESGSLKKEAKPYSKKSADLYENHPLKLMADTKRENLLRHPTVTSLLYVKWKKYGQKFYLLNLLGYILYLTLLNYYVWSTPPRFAVNSTATEEAAMGQNSCIIIIPEEQAVWGKDCQDLTSIRFITVVLVLSFSAIQLFKEVVQLLHQRLSYFLEYTNYIEVTLYILSVLVFLDSDPFVHETGLRARWQWECLAFVILLAWINLLLYIRKSPLGIYVLMIESVAKSFAKFGLIVLLFLIGFSGSFYILLQNQFVFDKPVVTWIKTLVMMTGEFDFQGVFLSHFESEAYQDGLQYEATSYAIFVIFVLLMSLLISNLLVGIAVDDIATVQEQATLRRLALQVNGVLSLEYALPDFIRRRMVMRKYTIKPNKRRRNLFSNWILSEEKVNLNEIVSILKDTEITSKEEDTSGTCLTTIETSLKSILSNQAKLEKEMALIKKQLEPGKTQSSGKILQISTAQPPLSSQSRSSFSDSDA